MLFNTSHTDNGSIPKDHISSFTGGPSRVWLLLTVTLNDHMAAYKWNSQTTNEHTTSMYATDFMASSAYCSMLLICDHSVTSPPSNMF